MAEKRNASDLKGKTGLRRLVNATGYSVAGFKAAWKTEEAFRQETVAAAVLIPVAMILPATATQKALLILTALLLIVVEVLNSAVEAVVDRIGPEIHPLSKKAKDLGSLAVLVAIFAEVAVWLLVLADVYL